MAKILLSMQDLQARALAEIRKQPGCSSVRNIAINHVTDELTPEQRDTYWWKIAIHTLNNAIKEPRYIKAATVTLQTALNLSGMLAQPP
jgi:hypothetical protein